MPIFDIEYVRAAASRTAIPSVQTLADALGRTLAAKPGRVWVRMRLLDRSGYAENAVPLADEALPVFVRVLLAQPPVGDALAAQAAALADCVARCFARRIDLVHLEYAAPGAGRVAFGGKLVE